MIQELLGGGSSSLLDLGGERKISSSPINCGGISRVLEGSTISSSSPSTLITNTATTTTTTTTTAAPTSDQQNLRCPRCDSSNTKFCYYNNYNLTQPRHFCKTCRRYWTKGGALRNVPIGGGCRKNKSSIMSTIAAGGKASSGGKNIRSVSPDIVKPSLSFGFHDHDPPSTNNQVLWPSQPHTSSQLLALLRASTQNPNPNHIKEEGNMTGSHMITDSIVTTSTINARSLGLDHTSTHLPFSLCSSFWRNNQNQTPQQQQQQQQQQQENFLAAAGVGEVQNTGFQELYQRLRSSTNYYSDHSSSGLNNVASQSTNSSFEPVSTLTGSGELGTYWNPSFSWSNLSTSNGAFP